MPADRRNVSPSSLWASFTGIWESDKFGNYLHRRGYRSVNDWPFFRRAFLEAWAETGFHRFWRIWNPALGFLTFRLYRKLGGSRRDPWTKVLAFAASGFAHNILVFPFLGWSWTLPVTFTSYGILVAIAPFLSRLTRQASWPRPLNAVVNLALVVLCFSLGFQIDELICRLGTGP